MTVATIDWCGGLSFGGRRRYGCLLYSYSIYMFGSGGEGFMRLNVGTQRRVLQEALERLEAAFR